MKNFIIADLERLSDVKAHTLRTWEQRYGFPKPVRSSSNIRHYSIEDLKQVLSISLLNRYGYKISQLVLLSEPEVLHHLKNIEDTECKQQMAINQLLLNMYSMDSHAYEKAVDFCFLNWPAHTVIENIISPFLKRTELLWQGKRLCEEHLVVTILRRKLLWCIEQLPLHINETKSTLLFLPDARQLDLSLLCTCFLLKYSGSHVIYMGSDVSIDNLSVMFDKVKPDFIYTYLPVKSNFQIEKLLSIMQQKLPSALLLITSQFHTSGIQTNTDRISMKSFKDAVQMMSNSKPCIING